MVLRSRRAKSSSSFIRCALFCLSACATAPKPATKPFAAACKGKPVLFVASQPPRPGETLRFEYNGTFDIAGSKRTIHGTDRFLTDEVVRSVANDAIEELEVTFVEARHQPDDSKPATELTGVYRVHGDELGNATFTQNDQPPASEEIEKALRAWSRNDVGVQEAVLEMLTDRTYVLGQETHLKRESIIHVRGDAIDARLTLIDVAPARATFKLEMRTREHKRGLRFFMRGQAVLDTEHARLVSIDEVSALDLPPALATKVHDRFEIHEIFRYGNLRPASPPRLTTTCEAKTLRIARRPDEVGETYEIEQKLHVDERITNVKSAHTSAFQTELLSVTKSRVVREEGDLGETIEVAVQKEHIEPFDDHGTKNPVEDHDGEQLVIATQPGGMRFTRNGASVSGADVGIASILDSEAAARWSARLATDRTYEVGVEQTFNHELIPILGRSPIRVRVVLVSFDAHRATFNVDMKTTTDGRGRFMRGELEMDVKKARPISMHLRSELETPDTVSKEGDFSLDYKFRY